LVVINHGRSGEAGVRKLSEHLMLTHPVPKVTHCAQSSTYEWMTGGE
jgi:hypothetical protein